jgi:hypothetical protein
MSLLKRVPKLRWRLGNRDRLSLAAVGTSEELCIRPNGGNFERTAAKLLPEECLGFGRFAP